ncbi:MAG TPA: sigma-70 family RNA polymerase sigma factor [Nitrolancea sp.]|nr:sigma-70 family RNA polymerase sigma factor [Nitrolancea sp.]
MPNAGGPTMDERDWLATQFEEQRAHLRSIAYRMLGSTSEAEDAVQESWFRLSRTDTERIDNLGGWLTTVVSRVCLDMLRSRKLRGEETLDAPLPEAVGAQEKSIDPEQEAVLADSVGLAMLVVLDTLAPPERIAFVLHDLFAVPFDQIATILGRTPAAARQLASRARRRVQGNDARPSRNRRRQQEIVGAFFNASRNGDFAALLTMLAPDAVLHSDPATVADGAMAEVLGAEAVAGVFSGRAHGARLALVDGTVGAVAPSRDPHYVFEFVIVDDRITQIDILSDPAVLAELDIQLLPPQKMRDKPSSKGDSQEP